MRTKQWDPNNKPVVETIPAGVAPAVPQDAPAEPKADDDPFSLGGDDAPEPEELKADDDPGLGGDDAPEPEEPKETMILSVFNSPRNEIN